MVNTKYFTLYMYGNKVIIFLDTDGPSSKRTRKLSSDSNNSEQTTETSR